MALINSLLRPGAAVRLARLIQLLDAHFAARSDADLAIDDHLLAGLDTLFDDYQITLPLTECNLSLFRG